VGTPFVPIANLKNISYERGKLLVPRWKVGSLDRWRETGNQKSESCRNLLSIFSHSERGPCQRNDKSNGEMMLLWAVPSWKQNCRTVKLLQSHPFYMLSGTMGTCNMPALSFLTFLLRATTTLVHSNAVRSMSQ
jgi:hypothetical protein